MSDARYVPLPVLTTHRPDRRDRGYLAWVAVAHEVAHLPLETPPVDASPHALEIHVSGFDAPLVVLADPMGPPTDQGFPLKLRPLDDAHEAELRYELFGGERPATSAADHEPSTIKYVMPAIARDLPGNSPSTIPPPMSESHAHSLSRVMHAALSTSSRRAPGSLTERSLGDGRFYLERLLGGGASGEVYRAVHTTLRRAVAVKVLHPQLQHSPDYCARFYGEALAASRLDHRNVLRVLDYGQEPDGLLYIVMELLEGKSLQDILDAHVSLPLARIVHLVAQACAGLAHAHDAGVVHRDIKPENIVIVRRRDDEGRETELVKVCDFGIAHWTPVAPPGDVGDENAATIVDRPDASQVVGTPAYMAPEQIRNEAVDARTDVYALGIVLYELATGRVPFSSPSAMQVLSQHLYDIPARPSTIDPRIDPALDAIIMKALEKDPNRRFSDARALRGELRALDDDDDDAASAMIRRHSVRSVLTAADFMTNTAEALGSLHGVDGRARSDGYAALAEAMKTAFSSGKVKLGGDLASWLDARLADPALRSDEREDAERAKHVLRDPDVVRALVGKLVEAPADRRAELVALLVSGAPVAARLLIDMRRRNMTSLDLRAQFVATLASLGAPALPAIVSALESLAALATRQDEALAEDLLRAVPNVVSDSAGEVTARFVRLDKPPVGVAALRATASLWGSRARPLLVGVLDARSDPFRLLAIEWLQRLGGIDDAAVERLARIVVTRPGHAPAGDDVRLAAAAAFASALPESRQRALWFLRERLAPQQSFVSSLLKAIGPREDVRVVAALARSFARLDPHGARPYLERAASASPDLRPYIEAILAGR